MSVIKQTLIGAGALIAAAALATSSAWAQAGGSCGGAGCSFDLGIGGGGSWPSAFGEDGSGSGFGYNAAVGTRLQWNIYGASAPAWVRIMFGVKGVTGDEGFPPPAAEVKVTPGPILYQAVSIGWNIGPGVEHAVSPYFTVGVGEADVKVSVPGFSDQHWNEGPMVGGGIRYRLDRMWSVYGDVSAFFLSSTYSLGGGMPFAVNEHVIIGTIGFTYDLP